MEQMTDVKDMTAQSSRVTRQRSPLGHVHSTIGGMLQMIAVKDMRTRKSSKVTRQRSLRQMMTDGNGTKTAALATDTTATRIEDATRDPMANGALRGTETS